MNHRITFFRSLKFALLSAALATALPSAAAPVAETNAAPQVVRSVFIQPASPKEGRDPFFPNSDRPYRSQIPISSPTADVGSLVLQSIYGAPGNRLAIINNVTFGVGDYVQVRTSQGRIGVQCVEITDDSAVVEVDGQRSVLIYKDKP
jgi:hypothetical protein